MERAMDGQRGAPDSRRGSPTCAQPCPMCGSPEPPVHVHGHGQCAVCKVNIDPCCGGAPLDGVAAA